MNNYFIIGQYDIVYGLQSSIRVTSHIMYTYMSTVDYFELISHNEVLCAPSSKSTPSALEHHNETNKKTWGDS